MNFLSHLFHVGHAAACLRRITAPRPEKRLTLRPGSHTIKAQKGCVWLAERLERWRMNDLSAPRPFFFYAPQFAGSLNFAAVRTADCRLSLRPDFFDYKIICRARNKKIKKMCKKMRSACLTAARGSYIKTVNQTKVQENVKQKGRT